MSSRTFAGGGEPLALHCIGVQFGDVPAPVRDRLALGPAGVSEALATIATTMPGAEALVLATCHRTELFVVEANDPDRVDLWHRTVGHRLPGGGCPGADAARHHLVGVDAAEHLLRVVAGLESAELGDQEIAGQVRRARELAVDAGTVGPVLHRLLDAANTAGRRARTETAIGEGGAGVGLATARAVLDVHPELAVRGAGRPGRAVVVGAGDAGAAVARELHKRTALSLTIANRTFERAADVADRYRADAIDLDQLDAALLGADVVVLAVHGDEPVIDAARVARLRDRRPSWSPLVVDTCVPRMCADDVDLRVLHLDELADRAATVRAERAEAVPAVEAIVAEVLADFGRWYRDRALDDVVAELFREAEELTAAAVGLVDDDRAAREIHRAVRRLVHQHITRLRAIDGPVDGQPRNPRKELR